MLSFVIVGGIACLFGLIVSWEGKRLLVSKSDSTFVVVYKELKPIAAPGDGDAGLRYSFRVGRLGLIESDLRYSSERCYFLIGTEHEDWCI